MGDERVARAREIIWEAVRANLAAGGTMQAATWGVDRVPVEGKPGISTWVRREDEGCCPMGAMLLGRETASSTVWAGILKIQEVLGCTDNEGCDFMAGYDGRPIIRSDDPWFVLGREARLEFGP